MYSIPGGSLHFYSTQSDVTDPGEWAHLFEALPSRAQALAAAVYGLVSHFGAGELHGVTISEERREKADARFVEGILARIAELDGRPLTVRRAPEARFVGCCRDYAVLLTAMLRHRGAPARARSGFARYLSCSMHIGHWVCEYWHDKECRWVMVDAQLLDPVERRHNKITFDPLDVPHTQFLAAGRAWQMCRIWGADPERFSPFSGLNGLAFIAAQVVRDLACLNRVEPLAWDRWGLAHTAFTSLSEADLTLLDEAARLTLKGNESFLDVRALYQTNLKLRAPNAVHNFAAGELQPVSQGA